MLSSTNIAQAIAFSLYSIFHALELGDLKLLNTIWDTDMIQCVYGNTVNFENHRTRHKYDTTYKISIKLT